MALRDTIQEIADDMAMLQALAVTALNELKVNTEEGFADPNPSIGTELTTLISSRKTVAKSIQSIKKKITDIVKTNLDTL